eukprot:Protomagalhaensia_wolfi_Nauph_80__5906@NODE_772_length_2013_cov_722_682371_g581_i0_p3_GENE_NODE_772_length_2013_cov_722_682371_g581_i0NODE_772_length_2013_cov_722_682371_g581_i0_p3_ORF_typecomplete_len101_score9_59_NODE_772_length_2013_cov_722_682371_g581_i0297599
MRVFSVVSPAMSSRRTGTGMYTSTGWIQGTYFLTRTTFLCLALSSTHGRTVQATMVWRSVSLYSNTVFSTSLITVFGTSIIGPGTGTSCSTTFTSTFGTY